MPFYPLAGTIRGRSTTQANNNTETIQAVVKNTYKATDGSGNVFAADVRLPNGGNDILQVQNLTGLKLSVGDTVQINFVNGQRHFRAITGALGAGAINAANAQSVQDSSNNSNNPVPLPPGIALSGVPFLLQNFSSTVTGGFVEDPGSNIYFTDTPPSTASGGVQTDGTRVIAMRRLVLSALPGSGATALLPIGTLIDLQDSYGISLGMYRLDAVFGWVREDVGSINDHKVAIDTSDTTPGYLSSKLVAGENITFNILGSGGNEQIQINTPGVDPTAFPSDYISGCNLIYSTTTAIQINTGRVGLANGLSWTVASVITNSPTLAVSTTYYVYLTSATTVSVTSTAPTSNYAGWASNDGTTSHRYVGSFTTDASAHIRQFNDDGYFVQFNTNTRVSPFQVLTTGAATTATSVSCSTIVPNSVGARKILVTVHPAGSIGANGQDVAFGTSDWVPAVASFVPQGNPTYSWPPSGGTTAEQTATLSLNVSQAFQYILTRASSTTITIYVQGYWEKR